MQYLAITAGDHIRAQTIKSHARGQGYLRFFAVRG
ncbi:hypothetical protein CUMW_192640 [Citrus unshiu]|uniref:Uncharacterized protein n=1 Tax=Citrus unshiu TaxID=55188 RepID=A0A2H5Q3M7_CITUN|nr:hypothetical protein CUMW_192640 [Citrus unshiu]